jgi:hypothetical protein
VTADTYDFMRAGGWDVPPGERLPTLLAMIGAVGQPLARQQEILRAWTEGPAYHAAPEYLKNECRLFLAQAPTPASVPLASSPQQAKWQARLDAMFPGGAISTWSTGKTVPVSWVQVAAMAGLDPLLAFYTPFGWVKEKHLVSLETVQASPHLIAMAHFDDGSTVQLTAAIPDGLAGELAKSRADVIAGNVTPA